MMWQLELVAYTFKIGLAEIKAADDPSVKVVYMPYGLAAWNKS
jgi:hypothetical protein